MTEISAKILAHVLHGGERNPTPQQEKVTQAPPGPMLVVAGAGAGKTETMASRVVWLAANGHVKPDQVLGLTFTRKAAQGLGQRIREQLRTFAASPKARDLDPTGNLAEELVSLPPTVSTYDSYAGQLIREYGLLVPVEPDARLITDAELYSIAHRVVSDYTGALSTSSTTATVTENLLDLMTEMDNGLVEASEVAERTRAMIDTLEYLPKGPRQKVENYTAKVQGWLDKQQYRLDLLPLVAALKRELKRLGVVTFNEQMSVAARLALSHPAVAESQRRRFRVVMLDEYQDTSYAQRILLSNLFGTPDESVRPVDGDLTVTAVGDPMQAIYGWRGATVENLAEFVHDFPAPGGPADKLQLTTSWRNPGDVLELANVVADHVFGAEERPVDELEPRSGAENGEVHLAHYATAEEEIEAVADLVAEQYRAKVDAGEKFTGAVLVRKNRQAQPVAEALAARGVPFEISGVGGLLNMPEVADLVAIATMLVRPGDSQAALRVLSGPIVGLGLADLDALQRRARNLAGRSERPVLPDDPAERLKAQIEDVTTDPPDQVAGLADAVADLGETDRYSEEGLDRLRQLSSRLRALRTTSLGKSLPDLFADIESVFDVRTEVLSRPDARERGGAAHLDRFAEVVDDFRGESLGGLLSYLELAREQEKGLEAGEVTVQENHVQIMTVHKAKGLEWDVVAVVNAGARTYSATASTYLSNAHLIPGEDVVAGYADVADRKEFEDAGEEFIAAERAHVAEENARLFYVAITRTERFLSVSAGGEDPYELFAALAKHRPDRVVAWADGEDADEAAPEAEPRTAHFPNLPVDDGVLAGARAVRDARSEAPELSHGETFDLWEREVSALIEEHEALSAPVVDVELPGDLTASDLVNIKADALQFARRQRRPVPFKPNTFAKRGTAFHQWLEDRFGRQSLLDENQLPGLDEEVVDAEYLEELKEKFTNSEWADRTPEFVEQPFEVSIGDVMVRGRMDAVFREKDGSWTIVDWKTGHFPTGSALRTAEIQLAVYQEAWRRIVGADADVKAAFYYVAAEKTFDPPRLPDAEELSAILASATGPDEG